MNRIPLEQLEDMFRAMRAQSGMDVDGPLLWGYFFTGSDPDKLEAVAAELQTRGYRLANLYPTDDGETHFLHVERIEPHTPLSLHERNAEFYALADTYGLESYDGMDVGPVEPMQGSLRRPWWKFW